MRQCPRAEFALVAAPRLSLDTGGSDFSYWKQHCRDAATEGKTVQPKTRFWNHNSQEQLPLGRQVGRKMQRANRIAGWALAVVAAPALLLADAKPKVVIPAGTRIDVVLVSTLSSSVDRNGDGFTAKVEDPVFVGGEDVIPAGSTLRGHVTFVKPPGRVRGKAEMRLVADEIVTKKGHAFAFTGQLGNSQTSSVKVKGNEGTVQGPSKTAKQTAKDAGIGAAIGAGGGVLVDGGTGALYGVGAGALVGLISYLIKHHKNVVLQPGTELTFVLTSAATETKATASKAPSGPFICTTCR